jgi:hypothetical protein
MGPRTVRARLKDYEQHVRGLLELIERDAANGRPIGATLRLRLRTFVERLNRDLLELYESERSGELSPAQRDVLLPTVAELRNLLRGLDTLREPGAAVRRLRTAAAAVGRD